MGAAAIPDAVLDGDLAVIARKGAGKSYLLRGLVERNLDARRRTLILDPQNIWHGLKTLANGEPGYAIPVIGGANGDVPLDPARAPQLARFLAENDVSAVVDVSDLKREALLGFVTELLEELYPLVRDPLWLVLEEADVFAPQVPSSRQTREMHDQVDRIVRRGRAFGWRVWTATQRPARLSKDVLTQTETMFLLQVSSPQDRAAADDWISGHAEKDKAAEIRAALASLPVGEGFMWSPRLELLERMKFPAIKTLDTSSTPSAGDRRRRTGKAAVVDVEALRQALMSPDQLVGQAVASASASNARSGEILAGLDDRARDQLEREAYQRGFAACEAEHAKLPTYQDGWRAGAIEVLEMCREDIEIGAQAFRAIMGPLLAKFDEAISNHQAQLDGRPQALPAGPAPGTEAKPSPPTSSAPPAALPRPAAGGADPDALGSMARRLLNAVQRGPGRPLLWTEVAILAGVSSVSGPFRAARNQAIAAGVLVDEALGVVLGPTESQLPTISAEEVAALWTSKLPSMARRVFEHIYVAEIDTPAHAALVMGVSGISGPYRAAWKALRNNSLVKAEAEGRFRLAAVIRELKAPR